MPEVADGAGLLFDPHQTGEITRALTDILLDAELRGRMERLGLQRAAGFTWKKSARATLDVYRKSCTKLPATPAAPCAGERARRHRECTESDENLLLCFAALSLAAACHHRRLRRPRR